MFSKSDKSPATATTPPAAPATPSKPSGTVSIISSDLKILGDLESAGDVQVEGLVEGDVRSRSLTIGEAAHVKGSVYADQVMIAGTISGQVRATSVSINKTAKVMGDIAHETLSIEAGAHLEGRFSREEFHKGLNAEKTVPVKAPKPAANPGNGSSPTAGAPVSEEPVPVAAAAGS